MLQNAEQGLPHGSARPFGYEPDKITLRETEAKVVREMVDRYLAGASIRSLTIWLERDRILARMTARSVTKTRAPPHLPLPISVASRSWRCDEPRISLWSE